MFEMQVAWRRYPIESERHAAPWLPNDLVVFAWSSDESVSTDCGLRDGGRQTSTGAAQPSADEVRFEEGAGSA
jgi:hypothetical protein